MAIIVPKLEKNSYCINFSIFNLVHLLITTVYIRIKEVVKGLENRISKPSSNSG